MSKLALAGIARALRVHAESRCHHQVAISLGLFQLLLYRGFFLHGITLQEMFVIIRHSLTYSTHCLYHPSKSRVALDMKSGKMDKKIKGEETSDLRFSINLMLNMIIEIMVCYDLHKMVY